MIRPRAPAGHLGGRGVGVAAAAAGCGGVAQLVRAPACHAGGRGFEPRHSRHCRYAGGFAALRQRMRAFRKARSSLYRGQGGGGRRLALPHCGEPAARALPMASLLREYFPILVFLVIAGAIAVAMVAASFVLARQRPDSEKLSPYECGFEPFEDARIRFDVRYYLVAILFIIFDLEVAFLFPWAVSLGDIGLFGFWAMIGFLAVLTIGFVYEWKKGALEWE